jgi:hypothetical protein
MIKYSIREQTLAVSKKDIEKQGIKEVVEQLKYLIGSQYEHIYSEYDAGIDEYLFHFRHLSLTKILK